MPPLRIGVCYLEGDLGDERVFAFKSAEGKGTVKRNSGSQQTCMGLFLSSGCFGFAAVLCSEREGRSSSRRLAIRFAERAEGVKGPKR